MNVDRYVSLRSYEEGSRPSANEDIPAWLQAVKPDDSTMERVKFMRYAYFILGLSFIISIPYIIWQSLKYQFYGFNIIDKNMPIKEAFQESAKAMQGHKFQLFLFFMLLCLINFLGLLALGLGLTYTLPLSALAYAHAYKMLAN